MQVKKFHLGPMMTNCFLTWGDNGTAYFFDCGGKNLDKVEAFIKDNQLSMKYLILTHGHGDHIDGIHEFIKRFPETKIYIGKEEKEFLSNPNLNLNSYISGNNFEFDGEIHTVQGGDMIGEFLVLDTPGHTIGSKSFYHKDSNILMAGDTLFYHSYGRFDLPTGSQRQLVESLRKLCELPENVIVYNGHTEETTIGEEKEFLGFHRR